MHEITKQVILQILKNNGITLSTDICNQIDKVTGTIESTQLESKRLKQSNESERKRHQSALNEIERSIIQLQSKCGHEVTKFYPDASGNNDSETICLICGKRI